MNTTEPLTALQLACDLFIIDHMTRLPNGDISLPWSPDEWPAGASASDIAASYERVRANLRRKPSPIAVARAYRDATPTESMVIAEPDPIPPEIAEPYAPSWIDHTLLVGVIVLVLTWVGLAVVGLMFVCGVLR